MGLVYVSACVPVEGETMQEMHKSSAAAVQENTNGFDMLSTIEMVDGKVALKEEIKEAFYRKYLRSLSPSLCNQCCPRAAADVMLSIFRPPRIHSCT